MPWSLTLQRMPPNALTNSARALWQAFAPSPGRSTFPVLWALAIALTAYWAVFSGFIFHAYPLLIEAGFESQTVAFALAIMARPR